MNFFVMTLIVSFLKWLLTPMLGKRIKDPRKLDRIVDWLAAIIFVGGFLGIIATFYLIYHRHDT